MNDPSKLPETLVELKESGGYGLEVSDRIIDPLVLIDRIGQKIVARLAGMRVAKGAKTIILAPTNRHAWVKDGEVARPIPRDATRNFAEITHGMNPDDLAYSEAIRLLRNTDDFMTVEAGDAFLSAGRIAAEHLDGKIVVPGLNATLFPYQARGVRWMWETINYSGGLILADEMGLGKTLQIIALLLLDPPATEAPALIICPTSLIANWVREFSRFAASMTLLVHRGPERTGVYRGLQVSNVVITTYDTMVNDISIFSSFEWSWVICDEAQAIKNPGSNRRQAIVTIPRRRAIPMTGTPVENSLLDLWSLADFAIPGILGSQAEFESKYPDNIESAQTIGRITDPIILKRMVADVAADLPDRIDVDIPLELDEQLAAHYLMVRQATLAKYPVAGALVATLQLQLVCAHPWLCRVDDTNDDGESAYIARERVYPLITPKMERVVSLLHEAFLNQKKVIIFSIFNRLGDLIEEAAAGFPDAYWGAINGSTASSERQQIVDEFSSFDGPGCLILNPKAAGAGLNITAATVVIHFTPVWNPALEAQASARAHRRGQTQPVTIYRLFYKDTVEEVMIDRSLWKSELANESIPVSSRDAADLQRALAIMPGERND